jgi:hypothetical protein
VVAGGWGICEQCLDLESVGRKSRWWFGGALAGRPNAALSLSLFDLSALCAGDHHSTDRHETQRMFKRLNKKRQREQEDEESGLKEIKAILDLGGEDEISGESESESEDEGDDSDEGSEDGEEEDGDEEHGKSSVASSTQDEQEDASWLTVRNFGRLFLAIVEGDEADGDADGDDEDDEEAVTEADEDQVMSDGCTF